MRALCIFVTYSNMGAWVNGVTELVFANGALAPSLIWALLVYKLQNSRWSVAAHHHNWLQPIDPATARHYKSGLGCMVSTNCAQPIFTHLRVHHGFECAHLRVRRGLEYMYFCVPRVFEYTYLLAHGILEYL